jgi:ribosomal protein L37AE/L43A
MAKYYVHPEARFENGKYVCSYCGRELPGGKAEQPFPCTTSVETPFDTEISISVWDCRASLLMNIGGKWKALEDVIDLSEKEKKRLEELVEESIAEAGGSITWSGIYPPSPKLCKFVNKILRRLKR